MFQYFGGAASAQRIPHYKPDHRIEWMNLRRWITRLISGLRGLEPLAVLICPSSVKIFDRNSVRPVHNRPDCFTPPAHLIHLFPKRISWSFQISLDNWLGHRAVGLTPKSLSFDHFYSHAYANTLMHFKREVTWTHGIQPNTINKGSSRVNRNSFS